MKNLNSQVDTKVTLLDVLLLKVFTEIRSVQAEKELGLSKDVSAVDMQPLEKSVDDELVCILCVTYGRLRVMILVRLQLVEKSRLNKRSNYKNCWLMTCISEMFCILFFVESLLYNVVSCLLDLLWLVQKMSGMMLCLDRLSHLLSASNGSVSYVAWRKVCVDVNLNL